MTVTMDKSMHKSMLKGFNPGSGKIKNLYDLPRFDVPWIYSRHAGHSCKKDYKAYRPWQWQKRA